MCNTYVEVILSKYSMFINIYFMSYFLKNKSLFQVKICLISKSYKKFLFAEKPSQVQFLSPRPYTHTKCAFIKIILWNFILWKSTSKKHVKTIFFKLEIKYLNININTYSNFVFIVVKHKFSKVLFSGVLFYRYF